MIIEAMRQALEALKTASSSTQVEQERLLYEAAIKRIRNAIDESETMQTQEPDMQHPKVQAIIGARARLQIELRLIEQLLDDPDFETTASDMEFWGPLHDRLKVRLAQPDQEPVATVYDAYDTTGIDWHCKDAPATGTKLYTAPPQREWQGLTKREFLEAVEGLEDLEDCWVAIQAKLKEKNT